MNYITNKWFRPASLLFGMVLVFDFFGHYSYRQHENYMKAFHKRQQNLFDSMNNTDHLNLYEDWCRVGNSIRAAMASVK